MAAEGAEIRFRKISIIEEEIKRYYRKCSDDVFLSYGGPFANHKGEVALSIFISCDQPQYSAIEYYVLTSGLDDSIKDIQSRIPHVSGQEKPEWWPL